MAFFQIKKWWWERKTTFSSGIVDWKRKPSCGGKRNGKPATFFPIQTLFYVFLLPLLHIFLFPTSLMRSR